MKFAISTLPFLDYEIDIRLFEQFSQNNIQFVEIFAQKPHCDLTNERHRALIEQLEEQLHIGITSVHLPIYFNRTREASERKKMSLCSPDNNIRISSINEYSRLISAAASLSIPIAVLHTGIEENSDTELNLLIESLAYLDTIAKKNNILIALENHTTRYVSIELLIELIQKLDSDTFGICLDTGHSHIFSNYISDLNEARRYLLSLHLHDNNGEEDEHLFPYEGNIDFDYIIGFLRTSHFQGVATLELNGENKEDTKEGLTIFLKRAALMINGFSNPRLTYQNLLEPT
jgi:sugar phosphate isomerase/epimerase